MAKFTQQRWQHVLLEFRRALRQRGDSPNLSQHRITNIRQFEGRSVDAELSFFFALFALHAHNHLDWEIILLGLGGSRNILPGLSAFQARAMGPRDTDVVDMLPGGGVEEPRAPLVSLVKGRV